MNFRSNRKRIFDQSKEERFSSDHFPGSCHNGSVHLRFDVYGYQCQGQGQGGGRRG